MVLFIVSEAVMFGAFFAQYFYARILSDTWPNPIGLPPGFERVPAAPLPVIMTVLLVASGFTAHWAQTAIHRNDRDRVEGWLIVTLLLGLAFLGVQAYEYASFILVDGFNITSGIYGTIFFSLTGLHGFHVIVGVVLLTGVMIRTFLGHFSSRNCFGTRRHDHVLALRRRGVDRPVPDAVLCVYSRLPAQPGKSPQTFDS